MKDSKLSVSQASYRAHNKNKVLLLAGGMLIAAAAFAQPGVELTDNDIQEIRALSAHYLETLGNCDPEGYAALFAPEVGYFASRYRGRMMGHEHLVGMVESERRCLASTDPAERGRPSGSNGVEIALEATASGARGLTDLGEAGEYHDEYVKTPKGWRFASRTALKRADIAAGLSAQDMKAIRQLAAPEFTDFYSPDQNGISRLRVSGVAISTTEDGVVMGRAYVKGGGYNTDIYEKTANGEWRIKSRTFVSPGDEP
ncbi:MAG TPA: nuclear transport factor 2 family protein [Hyphomicrobiales bacterium]|nr:nuclear transport factor 2 family protein [Hyphomicrobiales bacterium]